MITTDEGYKIPELGDQDFWDSFVFNWNRSSPHTHDGVDSKAILLASQTQDSTHRLVTDAQIAQWDAADASLSLHIADINNPHGVTKAQVGLAVAENTADLDKPISNATQIALNDINSTLGNHVTDIGNPHSVTKAQVGLGSADDTTDLNKPISNLTQAALDLKLETSLKGANLGLAELDAGGKVPAIQLPSYVDDVLEFPTLAAFPNPGETGKIYVALDSNLTYRWSGTVYVELMGALALGETSTTAYRGDRGVIGYDHTFLINNPHAVTKAQVGLGSADDTSDADKPISTATQTALDLKADDSDLTSHTGDTLNPHAVTKAQVGLGSADNTSDADKPVSTATQTALDLKADDSDLTSHTGNTLNPHAVTKAQVGLGSADNTSDADKPVSTATQTALDLKADDSDLTSHTGNTLNPHAVTKAQVGLGSADNTSDVDKPVSTAQQTALDLKLNTSLKGAASGLAELDSGGLVPAAQLPSYVDDVEEYADFASLPVTGETGKIYVTLDDNKTYRWSGSVYVEISASLALGETSSTAYRGDRGKIGYDHTFLTNNPHAVTKAQVGLTNADNTSDANKPVSLATQTALDLKLNTSLKGAINGLAELDGSGIVPSAQLPPSAEFDDGGVNLIQGLLGEPVTIPTGVSHFHPRMTVAFGELITIESGGYLLTKSDVIAGTVTIDAGGLWDVL